MSSSGLGNFHHIFIDNNATQTLFLLHGTGGDERDLVPLVKSLDTTFNFVGLRGNVSENGMNRFFERTDEGIFNQANIAEESRKLSEFLQTWYKEFEVSVNKVAFVGYSNGANMILAMSFLYPHLLNKAVVMHPMLPFIPTDGDLKGKQFLLTYGENDQMITAEDSNRVRSTLESLGATVEVVSHYGGHEIQVGEVKALEDFLVQSKFQ